MNKEVKELWVEALHERKFAQNQTGNLHDQNGFDALGVLCELHARQHGGYWVADDIRQLYTYKEQDNVLPLEVADWAGIPQTPLIDRFVVPVMWKGRLTNIARLEDSAVYFDELAEVIERKL